MALGMESAVCAMRKIGRRRAVWYNKNQTAPLRAERLERDNSMEKNYRAELTAVFGDPVDGNPTGVMEEAAYEAVSYTHLDVYKRQSLCYTRGKVGLLEQAYILQPVWAAGRESLFGAVGTGEG